jgi:transposase
MIRSTKHTLGYCNQDKHDVLLDLIDEYRLIAQEMIDWIWNNGLDTFDPTTRKLQLPKYLSSEIVNQFKTWMSARLLQCCGKQVIGMLNASVAKQRKRFHVLRKLQRKGEDCVNLQRYVDAHPVVKPDASKINLELDGRFVDFQKTDGAFDLFIRLSSIGDKLQINIPIRHHRCSRKWMKRGQIKTSIRLAPDYVCLFYDVTALNKKKKGRVLGCDQGYATTASFADQTLQHTQTTPERCTHGHDLKSICTKISRRKSGSKGMARARAHRKNFIGWSLNQISFAHVKQVNLEEVVNLRKGKRQPNASLMHWTYTQIKDKMERLAEEKGFLLQGNSSPFRSQRCSSCGWVLKTNRKGKTFTCSRCGFHHDADLNAASNHSFDLVEIPFWVRRRKLNRQGFYWLETGLFTVGHEPIVRDAKESFS